MLTVIAETVRVLANITARQYWMSSRRSSLTVLKEEGCHGYAPMVDAATSASFQATAPDSSSWWSSGKPSHTLKPICKTAHMKAWSDAVKRGRSGNPHPYSGARGLSSVKFAGWHLRLPGLQLLPAGPVSGNATGLFYHLTAQLLCLF